MFYDEWDWHTQSACGSGLTRWTEPWNIAWLIPFLRRKYVFNTCSCQCFLTNLQCSDVHSKTNEDVRDVAPNFLILYHCQFPTAKESNNDVNTRLLQPTFSLVKFGPNSLCVCFPFERNCFVIPYMIHSQMIHASDQRSPCIRRKIEDHLPPNPWSSNKTCFVSGRDAGQKTTPQGLVIHFGIV